MNWTYNTIWTEQLPSDEFQIVKCKNTKASLTEPISGTYFLVSRFKPKDRCFQNYPAITTATYLEFNQSNIHNFSGISKLGKIKRLELNYCTKLYSDEGLSELKNEIEWLHISQSKKFTPSDETLSLNKLKVLRLNRCNSIENLQFLNEFPELVDFRFVDTNIIDGDLTPLFEHPNLLSVGFINKRHYNRTEKEADEFFDKKAKDKKEWIHKGKYSNFRYKVFS